MSQSSTWPRKVNRGTFHESSEVRSLRNIESILIRENHDEVEVYASLWWRHASKRKEKKRSPSWGVRDGRCPMARTFGCSWPCHQTSKFVPCSDVTFHWHPSRPGYSDHWLADIAVAERGITWPVSAMRLWYLSIFQQDSLFLEEFTSNQFFLWIPSLVRPSFILVNSTVSIWAPVAQWEALSPIFFCT